MTTTSRLNLIVAKVLIALIILAAAFAVVGVLLYLDDRRQRREKAIKKTLAPNPDASWLYAQGLTPEEIQIATRLREDVK
jgi:hypothetical protein